MMYTLFIRLHRVSYDFHGKVEYFETMVNASNIDQYHDEVIWINGERFEIKETMEDINKLLTK